MQDREKLIPLVTVPPHLAAVWVTLKDSLCHIRVPGVYLQDSHHIYHMTLGSKVQYLKNNSSLILDNIFCC